MTYYSHLDHKKVRMDFAIYDSEDINKEYEEQIRQNHSKIFALPSVKDVRRHIVYCRKLFKKRHYDIVHDNTLINTIPLMREAKRANIPVRILHAHATKLGETRAKEFRNNSLLPFLKRYVNIYTACSNAAGKCLFKGKAYTLIPNVIDGTRYFFDECKRDKIRGQYNVQDKKVILTVGRIAEQKNPFFAIDVINELRKKDNNIVYWWLGDGPLREDIQKHVNELEISEYIRLLGSKADVEHYYIAADCFFLPSLFEGLPVSGIEAQTSGLPGVLSDSITKELVFTDLINFVSLKQPVHNWANSLEELLNRREDRRKAIIKYNESRFSAEGSGERLTNLYKEMLRQKENE